MARFVKCWVVEAKLPYNPCRAPSLVQQGPVQLDKCHLQGDLKDSTPLAVFEQGTVLLPGQRKMEQHLPSPLLDQTSSLMWLGVVGIAAYCCGSRA